MQRCLRWRPGLRYKSRISAVGLLVDANYHAPEKKVSWGMVTGEIPQTLRSLEKKAFYSDYYGGKKPVSSF